MKVISSLAIVVAGRIGENIFKQVFCCDNKKHQITKKEKKIRFANTLPYILLQLSLKQYDVNLNR